MGEEERRDERRGTIEYRDKPVHHSMIIANVIGVATMTLLAWANISLNDIKSSLGQVQTNVAVNATQITYNRGVADDAKRISLQAEKDLTEHLRGHR